MKKLYLINCIFIIILIGMRGYDIGSVDTLNYVNYFLGRQQSYHIDGSEVEIGISILNNFLNCFIKTGWLYLTIIAIITLTPLFYLILKFSPNKHLSMLFLFIILYIIPIYFICMRQILAMTFFLWGVIIWLYKPRFYKIYYCLLLIFGCTFHATIILPGLLFIFCCHYSIPRKIFILIAIVSFIIGVMRVLDNLMIFSFLFFSGGPLERLASYATIELSDSTGGYLYTLFRTILCIMLCLTLKDKEYSHAFSKMFLLGTLIFNILPNFSEIYRLGGMFTLFGIIPISQMSTILYNRKKQISNTNKPVLKPLNRQLLKLLFTFIILYSYFNYLSSNIKLEEKISTDNTTLIPYSFFWEDNYNY